MQLAHALHKLNVGDWLDVAGICTHLLEPGAVKHRLHGQFVFILHACLRHDTLSIDVQQRLASEDPIRQDVLPGLEQRRILVRAHRLDDAIHCLQFSNDKFLELIHFVLQLRKKRRQHRSLLELFHFFDLDFL